MPYNANSPADDQTLAAFPPEMREQLRAIINDQIVDALKLCSLSPGNASGNIPVSNGNLNTNLNAEKLGGNLASAFANANHAHSIATGSSDGFESSTHFQKVEGIQTGAEVNQMAFSNVLVGNTTIQADSKTDTLEIVAGTNISLVPDATNDRLTIAVSGKVASAAAADTATNATTAANATTANACTGNSASASYCSGRSEYGNRLRRNDGSDNYNVQTNWDGSYWNLKGYNGDTYHAPCKVGYADSAGSAPANGGTSTYTNYVNNDSYSMRFHWSGQGGQPTWLWGGSDGQNMYVYNPSNFSVNYANSAGNSDTVDGYHASQLMGGNATAWVCFNGSNGSIYSAHNVSSVTRNATGDYTVNFSSAMPNANYAYVANSSYVNAGAWHGLFLNSINDKTASSLRLKNMVFGGGYVDEPIISVTIFSN